jgi:hypothetical protein
MQFDQLNRREFITLLGGAGGAWLLVVDAQQAVFPQSLSAPADATMNSEAWNFLYCPNMPAHPTARDATSWEFNFPPRNGVHYLVQPVIGRPGSPLAAQSGWTTGNNVRIDIRWATSNAAEIRRHADWWCSLQMSSSERPTCEREPIHCESEHRIPLQS